MAAVIFTTSAAAAPQIFNGIVASKYVGHLYSTSSDANPTVQFYLSKGINASEFSFANQENPVLTSTVGTKGVRDIFLTSNGDRSQWYGIATGKQIRTQSNSDHL